MRLFVAIYAFNSKLYNSGLHRASRHGLTSHADHLHSRDSDVTVAFPLYSLIILALFVINYYTLVTPVNALSKRKRNELKELADGPLAEACRSLRNH